MVPSAYLRSFYYMAAHLPNASISAVIAPALPRNVYKVRGKVFGMNAYFAFTSTRQILEDRIHLVMSGETDAQLVRRLRTDLDQQDPVLKIIPRTVEAAVDGPSLSHPARLELIERTDAELAPIELLEPPLRFSDEVTADLYYRLVASLRQRLA